MTKAQKIAELKALYPTLQKGVNEEVIDLDAKEYEATIQAWAETLLAEEERAAAAEALAALKASAKAKLIAGQPLTAEEADTLVI